MMSYMWIFLLGSLIVTGVRMQEDGVEGAENTEAAEGNLAPEADEESPVTDDETTGTEDTIESPEDSDDAPPTETDEEVTDPDPPVPVEEAEAPVDPEAEDTTPDPDADSDIQPTVNPEEPTAAVEEPVQEEPPAEREADSPVDESEVTEQEITPEEAEGEVTEQPAEEEPTQEPPTEGEAAPTEDADETDSTTAMPDHGKDIEKDIEEIIKDSNSDFDLSDALGDLGEDSQPGPGENLGDNEIGDAGKQSGDIAGRHGKARSAGSASGPKESGSGTVVGVVCGIAVAAIGAITGYFTYLKKKLCFKVQGDDLERGKQENGTQNDPQVLSNLLSQPSS